MHRYSQNGKVPVSNIVQVGYGNKCILYVPSQEIFFFLLLWVWLAQGGGMVLAKEKKKKGFWPENKK